MLLPAIIIISRFCWTNLRFDAVFLQNNVKVTVICCHYRVARKVICSVGWDDEFAWEKIKNIREICWNFSSKRTTFDHYYSTTRLSEISLSLNSYRTSIRWLVRSTYMVDGRLFLVTFVEGPGIVYTHLKNFGACPYSSKRHLIC